MKKILIGNFEYFSIVVLYIAANDKISGYFFHELKQDTLITFIIAFFGSLILMSLYYLIFKRMNYVGFEEILSNLLGSWVAKAILTIYVIYFIFLASMDLKDITHLSHVYLLSDNNILVISIILILPVYISLLLGLESTSRASNLFFFSLVFVFLTLSVLLVTSNKLYFDNILPILEASKKDILYNAFYGLYSVPFGELFVFIIFFTYIKDKKKILKNSILAQVSIGVILLLFMIFGLLIIGPVAMNYSHTPSMLITRRIDIEQFIQRFDIIALMIVVLASYLKQFILLYAALYCIKKVFPKIRWHIISTIIIILSVILSVYFLREYLLYLDFRFKKFIPYVSPIFEILFPSILLLLTFIRPIKKSKSKSKSSIVIQ